MQTFQAGADVTLTFTPSNASGPLGAPWTLAWRVLDQTGAELQPFQEIVSPPSASPVLVTIPATLNVIPPPLTQDVHGSKSVNQPANYMAARTVELWVTTDAGAFPFRQSYAIRDLRDPLVLLVNSFQTLVQAEMEALMVPGLEGWPTATDEMKVSAMVEAHRRLTRLGYFVRWPRDPDAQNTLYWWDMRNEYIVPRLWQVMAVERYLTYYPEDFRVALRRAQICEADHILYADPIEKKRELGLLATSNGEAKAMFRSSMPYSMGISRRSMEFLTGYINLRQTLTRS